MGQVVDKLQTYEALLSRLALEVDVDDKKAIQDALSKVILCVFSARLAVINHVVATPGLISGHGVNVIRV